MFFCVGLLALPVSQIITNSTSSLAVKAGLTPLIPPDSKISGLKIALTHTGQQASLFSVPVTNLISVSCVLMKTLSHAYAEKKTKRLMDFRCRTFYWLFSSSIMAVKRLIFCLHTHTHTHARTHARTHAPHARTHRTHTKGKETSQSCV